MNNFDEMITDLTFFIDHNNKFDGSTIENIIEKYNDGFDLSDNQVDALVNVYEKWYVKKYVEKIKFPDS